MQTITDAYAHFESLHGGEHPVRMPDDLRTVIHETGWTYATLNRRFWDCLFDSGWAWGETDDLPASIVRTDEEG